MGSLSGQPELFRHVLDQARDIVLVVAADTRILYANRAAIDAYGYSPQEILALSVRDLRAPELAPLVPSQLRKAFTDGISFRSIHRRKTGEHFPVEVSSQKLHTAGFDAVVSIVRDITETIRAETSLRESQQQEQGLNEELRAVNAELTAMNEELTQSEENLRMQFLELLERDAKIQRQNSILSSLQETVIGLMQRKNPHEVLSAIVADATRLIGTEHGFIYLLEPERKVFRRTHGVGFYAQDIGREISASRGIVGLVRRTGKPATINDYDVWKSRNPDSVQSDHLKAVLQVPLKSGSQVIGTIGVAHCEPDKQFNADEIDTLIPFAEMASIALDNATLLESYAHELQERRTAEKSLQAMINAIPDTMFVLDQSGTFLDCNTGKGFFNLPREFFLGKNVEQIFPSAIAASLRFNVLRASETGALQQFEYLLPSGGEIEYYETRIAVSGKNEALVICRDVTDRKRMEDQLTHLSLHDALTNCYNRTFFEEEMQRFAKQRDPQISLLMCDVDGLKIVNDSFGHDAGDAILKSVADILRASFRPSDIIARIGGDEFVVLLTANTDKILGKACRQIKKNLALYNASHPTRPISLSMGYAIGRTAPVDMNALFKEADNNMYREKLHQKNSARSAIVQGLVKALEARDFITEGHGDRLQNQVEEFARVVGIPEYSLPDLRLLAHFHDIGKVGIPDQILFKSGPLTDEEWKIMRQHCEIGHRIANSTPDLAPIADWILKHQEWWNGKGYPLGIRGESIPIECRLLSIVDAFDAMTSDRPYRKALDRNAATAELQRCAGEQFDPALVETFTRLVLHH